MKNKANVCAVLLLLLLSMASIAQESVEWANWSSTSSGDFVNSNVTVSASQTAAGVVLINPDAGTQSSFTTWAGVDIHPNNSSSLENIPVTNSNGFRIENNGENTFTLSEPVDEFYVIFTSLGAPGVGQEFEILDSNNNELNMTIVGTAVNATRACTLQNGQPVASDKMSDNSKQFMNLTGPGKKGVQSGILASGNEGNCAVKVSVQGETEFTVNVLNDESFSVMNIGIPAGAPVIVGPSVRSVPTLSQWSLLILVFVVGAFGFNRQRNAIKSGA